jgi:hypothetical protein
MQNINTQLFFVKIKLDCFVNPAWAELRYASFKGILNHFLNSISTGINQLLVTCIINIR